MTSPPIHRVTTLESGRQAVGVAVRVSSARRDRRAFAEKQREKPALLETAGSCSGVARCSSSGERFSASYFETDFASFLAWRDWGFPDKGVFNGFGMGALLSQDGAFALGEMGQHTANAGRIYFPAGTPDLDDVRGEALDIEGSVAREVEEETGLVRTITVRLRIGIVSIPVTRWR